MRAATKMRTKLNQFSFSFAHVEFPIETLTSPINNYKKEPNIQHIRFFFILAYALNLDSATTYLPGRLPSEYCRREKSLRPCSGWERVVSFCLVTEKPSQFLLFKLISESIALRTGSCIMNEFDNLLHLVRFRNVLPKLLVLPSLCSHTLCEKLRSLSSSNELNSLVFRFQEKPSSD